METETRSRATSSPRLARFVPALGWARRYRRSDLGADALAGTIVAALLVPQAMAYALLAGLPPQAGLYASLLPLALYALLGTSRTLAVGPVAVVSLLVASGLEPFRPLTPEAAMGLAALLALGVGVVQLAMGLLRAGFLVNFLSHPVLSGFTSAAALVIALSQAGPLLGVALPRGGEPWEALPALFARLGETRPVTLAVGAAALLVLVGQPRLVRRWLAGRRDPGAYPALAALVPRAGPLVVVVLGTLAAWALDLAARSGLAVVGEIPAGLPTPALPAVDPATLRALAPTVLAIALVGFLESYAVAQSLAARRRESVEGSQELVALGAANLGAAVVGGCPVTGGFSRSMVNFGAGARSGVASLVTAGLVALTLVGLTPLLHHLPRAVLAAVIVVAVLPLVDLRGAWRTWRYDRADGAALLATFAGVFAFGVEPGIAIGAVLSGVVYLGRASRPHVAVVGRVGTTEHFRNVRRHAVHTDPRILALRIDENLYFGNARYLEEALLARVARAPELRHVVLIASGINQVDATGLDCLESCATTLAEAGVALHLAEVKGPVMDQLERAGFPARLGPERVHLSAHDAMVAIGARSAADPPRA